MSRHRNYCFTLNNYDNDAQEQLNTYPKFSYLVYGKEVAPTTGTPHLQGYFEMENASTISALIKKLDKCKGIHLTAAKGNAAENRAYCSKGGEVFETGLPKQQGQRSDLDEIKNQIKKGKKVDDICMENPDLYHMYGRTLSKIEDICMRKKFRNWTTEGEWYYGPTGVGKSHKAFENFDPETCYVWKDDNGWQDGYCGQETVIINEFRGSIPYSLLLQMLDKYPFEVRRRCREPMPFLAKKIIITSALCPEQVYKNLAENDSLDQLHRRLKIFYKSDRESEWELI